MFDIHPEPKEGIVVKRIKKPISLLLAFIMFFSVLTSVFVTSAAAATHLACVKQNDPIWKSYYYNEGNLYDTGCGIFSLVNAVGYLTGIRMSVTEVASWAYSISAFNVTDSEGTYRTALYPQVEKKYGPAYGFTLDCSTGTGYWAGSGSATLKNHLENGGVAVGHVPGHFIAIVGYNGKENLFHVYDSYATNSRGTTANNGDVWVTQAQFATGQLCLDWFCLLSATGNAELSGAPVTYSTGVHTTDDVLNLYSTASDTSNILTTVPFNTLLSVTSVSNGWGYTTYNSKSGYIRLDNATRVGDLPSPTLYTVGMYKTKSDLNMRSDANADSSILTVIPSGTTLTVTSISGNWGYTYYDGKSGYINLSYAVRTGDLPYTVGVYQLKGDLNMRDMPSASGKLLATLSGGTIVTVTKIIDGWGYISYGGKNGYINLAYATRIDDLPLATYPIGVYETTSDLNLRATPSAEGEKLTIIPEGSTIFVTFVENTCWGYTSYSGFDGYVNLDYTIRTGDLPASAESEVGIYTNPTDINIRCASSYDSDVVIIIPANTIFTVTKISSGWGYTEYNGYTGWVNLAYVTYVGPLEEEDIILGDVNGDGTITVIDATVLQRFIAKIINLNDKQMKTADVDANGIVTVLDATKIQRFVARIIISFD